MSKPPFEVIKHAQLRGHEGPIYALCHGRNEQCIFSGSSDCIIAEWNFITGEPTSFNIRLTTPVYSLLYIKDKGLLLAGNGTGGIHIINVNEKKELKLLQNHSGQVFDIKYSAKHNCFYSASADGTISANSFQNLKNIATIKLCDKKIRNLSLKNNEMATACGDGLIRIYDLDDISFKLSFPAHILSANAVAYYNDSDIILSGGRDALLNIWDAKSYHLIKSIPAHNYAIYKIEFSPDRKYFATASRDKTVKIWDAENFNLLLRLDSRNYQGHINSVNTLSWANDNTLISAGDDKSLIVWRIKHKS